MLRRTRIMLILIPLIIMLGLAAAESGAGGEAGADTAGRSYADRLAEARLKYNEETIHFYRSGIGRKRKGMINVRMYRSEDQSYYVASILDSTLITDEAEMEAILEAVMRDVNFKKSIYGSMANLKAQWIAHNIAHSMATGDEGMRNLIEMMVGEDISTIIGRTTELDLSPPRDMTPKEKLLYDIVEVVFQTDKQ